MSSISSFLFFLYILIFPTFLNCFNNAAQLRFYREYSDENVCCVLIVKYISNSLVLITFLLGLLHKLTTKKVFWEINKKQLFQIHQPLL